MFCASRDPWICRTAPARFIGWLIIAFVPFLPFAAIHFDLFAANSDVIFYTNMLSFVTDSLHLGTFWLRWIGEANSGYGNPAPLFYSPAPYLVTALLNWPLQSLHLNLLTQMMIGIYASQVLSGYTAWLWLKARFGNVVAYSGSQLFVLLPFKIIYICLNGNLAQVWALAFLPLWMLGAQNMLSSQRRAVALYALSAAFTYYMHPLTVIAFGAVPAVYVLWFGRHHGSVETYSKLLVAHVLALGLCLPQALPQYAFLHWIHPEGFLTGMYSWKNNFFHVDVILCAYYGIMAMLVATAIQHIPALKNSIIGREGCFFALVILGVAFMTQSISSFVWEWFAVLQYLQFPAVRLHAAALVAVTYLFCVWLAYYKDMLPLGRLAYHRVTILLLVVGFGVATFMHIDSIYQPGDHWDVAAARATHIVMPAEYQTQWGCRNPYDTLKNYYEHRSDTPPAHVNAGKVTVTIDAWQPPERIALAADVHSRQADIILHQCYFPLWEAHSDNGQPVPLSASRDGGLLKLSLPHGMHKAEITFTTLQAEQRLMVCLLALVCCLVLIRPVESKIPLEQKGTSA